MLSPFLPNSGSLGLFTSQQCDDSQAQGSLPEMPSLPPVTPFLSPPPPPGGPYQENTDCSICVQRGGEASHRARAMRLGVLEELTDFRSVLFPLPVKDWNITDPPRQWSPKESSCWGPLKALWHWQEESPPAGVLC